MKRTVAAKARTPNPSSDRPRVRATDPARESAQEGGSNSTEVHETTQAAVRETNREIEQTYSTLAKSAADLSLQWIETVRVSTNFALDFSRELIGVKSPYEFLELSTAHARKQFQTFAEQIHQLTRRKS